jgi:hypothetical protein
VVDPERAFALSMRFIAGELGFEWSGRRRKHRGNRQAGQADQAR